MFRTEVQLDEAGFRRKGTRRLILGVVPALALAVAACGSSSSGGSSPSSNSTTGSNSSSSASGSPVKLMVIDSVNSPIISNPEIMVGATAAVKRINASGGINGHQIVLSECNDQSTPTDSTKCARKAVSDGVAAVVGQEDISSVTSVPILAKAGIPDVGMEALGNSVDYTSPDVYPLTISAASGYFASPPLLVAAGDKRIATITLEVPSAAQDALLVKKMTEKAGGTYVGDVKVPASGVTDYSQYAQQLKQLNPQAVTLILQDSGQIGVAKADAAIGLHVTYAQTMTGFGGDTISQYGKTIFNGTYAPDPWPSIEDTSNPLIQQFTSDVKATGINPQATFSSKYPHWVDGINAWEAVNAVDEVGKTISGDITASSLTAALNSATNLTLPGNFKWSPGSKGPGIYPRVSNFDFYYLKVENGKLVTVSGPHDLSKLVPSSIS